MATQVKLYIEPGQEIRRFNLDVKATYEELRKKVESLVGHPNFRIFWIDNEKDQIVLGSADELAAAKEVSTDNLLRLFVRPTGGSGVGDKKKTHHGVSCDGCQGAVVGTRHKCLECADFDLCEVCQAKGIHSEHDFLAIRRPRSLEWRKLFVQGYGSRTGMTAEGEAAPAQEGTGCEYKRRGPCGGSARAPGHHGHPHRRCGDMGGEGPAMGPWGPMPPFRGPFGVGPFGGGLAVPPMCRRAFAARAAAAKQAAEQTLEMDLDLNRPVADLLADISDKVRNSIFKTKGDAETEQEVKVKQQAKPEETKKEELSQAEVISVPVTGAAETVVTDVTDAPQETVEELTKTESENGWTHLEAESVEETPKKEVPVNDEKALKDQRITAALRAMEEMGFHSEGHLLRRLLENYNGDIARVLDSIK